MFIIIAVMMLAGLVYMLLFFKKKYEVITVDYSEKVGNTIIESSKLYTAKVDYKSDLMIIDKLGIRRPVPPREVMLPTSTGGKKIYFIKFDNSRFGFRVPSMKNQVYTYKRDEKGNIYKNDKDKPILVKHEWQLCDDVVEPDVKHWEENEQDKAKERHKMKLNALEKWVPAMSLAMIFLFAVVSLNMTTKELRADKMAIMEKAENAQSDAKDTQEGLNKLINKITGQRVFDDEATQRQQYYNETK